MVQWIRNRLPVQGTQVPSLVQEDFACQGATKAHEPQPLNPHATITEAHAPNKGCPPLTTTRESPRTTKTWHNQKLVNK